MPPAPLAFERPNSPALLCRAAVPPPGQGGPEADASQAARPAGSIMWGPDGTPLHVGVECDLCGMCPIAGPRHTSRSRPSFDVCAECRQQPEAAAAEPYKVLGGGGDEDGGDGLARADSGAGPGPGLPLQAQAQGGGRPASAAAGAEAEAGAQHMHQLLVDWVWRYFSGRHAPTQALCQLPPRPAAGAAAPSTDADGSGGTGGAGSSRADKAGPPPHADADAVGNGGGRSSSDAVTAGPGHQQGPGGEVALPHAAAATVVLRPSPVVQTGLPPLYFQHEGHSRTIIGVERRRVSASSMGGGRGGRGAGRGAGSGPRGFGRAGGGGGGGGTDVEVVTLLVLDPGVPVGALEGALASRRAWQRYVRRGLHTLTKAQYQLMYVAPGLAGAEEREALKVMAAAEVYRGGGRAQPQAVHQPQPAP